MKFFKHFTNAHEGTLMTMFDEMGHAGIACYWILIELCGAKLEKEQDQILNEADFVFTFHKRILREKFRLSDAKVERWLKLGSTLNLFGVERVGREFKISLPKLLECLDRDSKRARQRRANGAALPGLDIDKDIEKELVIGDVISETDIEPIQAAYPKTGDPQEGMRRAVATIQTTELPSFAKAASHYVALMRKLKTPLRHMRSFPNFVLYDGEQYWRRYIERPKELDVPSAAGNVHDPALEAEVKIFMQAFRNYNADSAMKARDWLGEGRWRIIDECGGWHFLSALTSDKIENKIRVVQEMRLNSETRLEALEA